MTRSNSLPLPPSEVCVALLARRGWTVNERGCWVINASQNRKNGYGMIWHGPKQGGHLYVASRLGYAAWVGEISDGERVLHTCDNPPCINPAHLFLGSMQANMDDMRAKGRGRYPGRKRVYDDDIVARVQQQHRQGMSYKAIARATGITDVTVRLMVLGRYWQVGQGRAKELACQ